MYTAALLTCSRRSAIAAERYDAIDATLTMCPPVPRSTRRLANARQPLTTPPRLTSSTRSHSSAGVSRNSPGLPDTRVVDHDVGHAVFGAHLVGERVDRWRRRTRPACTGAQYHRAAAMSFAVCRTLESSMSLTTTSAPSRANSSAIARPMPLPAPVTDTSVSPNGSRAPADLARNMRPRLAGRPARTSTSSADRSGQHLRVRQRRPVPGLDVAAPQPRNPAGLVVKAVRPHERIARC